jgi:hypothetical protein
MLHKALFTAVLAATAAVSMNASAIGRLADVTVVDRSTGQTLPVHYYRGEYWVAGTPGAKYSVSVANASGGRVLAVMSVDGVNVLNGQTASTEQSGYVFNGYQRYEVTGWRKSNAEVAAFEFVASPASYAERTGRPAKVGVIGVALFKERVYQPPVQVTPQMSPPWWPQGGRKSDMETGAAGRAADSASNTAQPAPAAPAASAPPAEMAKRAEPRYDGRAEAAREKLGTGHGEREWSQVTHTSFERAQSSPNETIRIRYDSYENLVSMGVIQSPRPWQRTPNPFPDNLGYVPDPPRHWR